MATENQKATFQEIDRFRVSPTTEVAISMVCREDGVVGITINNYITYRNEKTGKTFTGFAKNAIFIPTANIKDLSRIINSIGA